MKINNAKLKACIKLSHKVTVYVPATSGVNQQTDNTEQVRRTAALMADCFGGSTSTAALGYWLSPVAVLVAENTTVVFAYASDKDLQAHSGSAGRQNCSKAAYRGKERSQHYPQRVGKGADGKGAGGGNDY